MRVLGSAVLAMEFLIMCFAMLLAKDNHEPSTIIAGAAIAILLLLTPGLLKKRSGWILGSILQFLMIGYAVVVPSMAIVGLIFGGLWIAAIVVGRKGEAARAALMASQTPNA
jgi:cellulose synthase/poly-beta-1,6-N-acetylglucosamine synthase-like glycosyltransferase